MKMVCRYSRSLDYTNSFNVRIIWVGNETFDFCCFVVFWAWSRIASGEIFTVEKKLFMIHVSEIDSPMSNVYLPLLITRGIFGQR